MTENRIREMLKERYRAPRPHIAEYGNPEYAMPEQTAKIKAVSGEYISCVDRWREAAGFPANTTVYLTAVPFAKSVGDSRVGELEIEVESLRNELADTATALSDVSKRLEFLEAHASGWLHRADCFEATAALEQVKQITTGVFGGEFKIREKEDCETAGDRFFEIRVKASGTVEEIVAKNDLWHSRIAAFAPRISRLFRLSLDVDEQ